jgi:lysophospholipase L1-like esterase
LFGLLAASLALNSYLFSQSTIYYRQLNETRLDPLNLNTYPPQANLEPGRPLALFYGDSRAASWPAPATNRAITFLNRGIGAQTSAQVALRFAAHVQPVRPDILILQVGVNDLKTIPLFPARKAEIIAACRDNIRRIVADANNLGATVILTTIFPVGRVPLERQVFWSDEVAASIAAVNSDLRALGGDKVILFDAYTVLADGDGLLRAEYTLDTLHLNDRGYAALNQALAPLLNQLR